jgi:hypothetical protein
MSEEIDTSFDVRRDTPEGKDPDTFSPSLRRAHQFLWSKALPGGESFTLEAGGPSRYLHHESELGEFFLASDSIVHTYSYWTKMASITDQIPEPEKEAFRAIGYTIGGSIVFPGNTIDGRPTLNGARGMNGRIADRFDLTLEAIRRHYNGGESPLSEVISRYSDFFRLFGDFGGYVEFFLLQDLVDSSGAVRFYLPFDDFARSPLPRDVDEYRAYRDRCVAFVTARTTRIDDWVARPG